MQEWKDLLKSFKDQFPGEILIIPSLSIPSEITVQVLNTLGETIYLHKQHQIKNEQFAIDLSTAPGHYLLKIIVGEKVYRKKIVIE